MNRMGANFEQVLAELKSKLKAPAVAVQLPMGAADTFSGVIDLVKMALSLLGRYGMRVEPVEIPAGWQRKRKGSCTLD